ncbi:hypothetical protein [Shewanella algicola]|uniref:hypothetical protein n=1 Tax=Shewanella algicola TaxID=640633 RepID=UPI0024944685|nr:hypothetical protein [Shewanella algicola]
MNTFKTTLTNLSEAFAKPLSQQQLDDVSLLVENSLNNKFQFGHEFYTIKDVIPTSLVDALAPYIDSGLEVNSDLIELEARYHESKFSFEFEMSHSLSGLVNLLIDKTSIAHIQIHAIYESDLFSVNHATQEINHEPSAEPSELHGIYCIIDLENGQSFLTQMSADEAKQAMWANTNDRLNGVNPYTTNSKKLTFYKASCLRRGLKTISAFNNCGDLRLVSTLLNLHDRQFNKAKAVRKVMPLNNYKFRCCSKQPSSIDQIFKAEQGSVVIPFNQSVSKAPTATEEKKHTTELLTELPDELYGAWESDTLGVGF